MGSKFVILQGSYPQNREVGKTPVTKTEPPWRRQQQVTCATVNKSGHQTTFYSDFLTQWLCCKSNTELPMLNSRKQWGLQGRVLHFSPETGKVDLVWSLGLQSTPTEYSVFIEGQPARLYRKGAVPQRSPFLGVPFYLCIQPLTQKYQTWRGNTYGEGACFRRSIMTPPRGRGPSAAQFWGPFYLRLHPLSQNYQIWRGNTYWDWLVYRGSTTPHPKGAGSQCFRILEVPLYYCVQPLSQNNQIWHGNTYGERACS